jgi:hypothetical protein
MSFNGALGYSSFRLLALSVSVHSGPSKLITSRMLYSIFFFALIPDWHEGLDVCGVSSQKRVRVEFEVEVKRVWTRDELANDDESAKKVVDEDLSPISKVEDELKWNVYLELTNGKLIGFDFVVSATGVIPNGDVVLIQ